jgi:MoaA/NifB/PqqE/SkfB family radical SAM enzyme
VFLKLTRHCNNRCRFCCDTVFWNGSDMPTARVKAKIEEGAAKGYRRLFLSGGEPTIHPDFLEILRYGQSLSYSEIITISNGRMFSYPQFATDAVAAGLTAAVVSINSHDESTHDSLVSVKGAFRQARRGVRNLQRAGCVVNLSAVVNQRNVHQLPDMVRAYHRWGAGAATFMQLIPNDRDWARSRRVIYYDLETGRGPVREALALARDIGLVVELKKFPDPFFEDHEEQISEPIAWALEVAEIDWRRPERYADFRRGEAIRCFGERCQYCAYRGFCAYLMRHQALRREGAFDGFLIDTRRPPSRADPLGAALARQATAPVCLSAPDVAAARVWLAACAGRPLTMCLESLSGAQDLPHDATVVAQDEAQLERVRAWPQEVQVRLNTLTAPWLLRHPDWVAAKGARLTLVPQLFLRLETARRGQVELAALLQRLPIRATQLFAIPPCLSGREDGGRLPHWVPGELLTEEEDIPAHARHYYWQRYFTKSSRCVRCRLHGQCDGAHINHVRHFGYRTLRPVP